MAGGRPRILNDGKRREVCALLTAGCGIRTAATYVCCTVQTIRNEMRRDREFADAVHRAEVAGQLAPLNALRRAASKNWRAAAWLLERTNPDCFGRKNPALLKPDEALKIVDKIFAAFIETVPDEETNRKFLNKIQAVVRDGRREMLAAARPHCDPEAELAKSDNVLSRLDPKQNGSPRNS